MAAGWGQSTGSGNTRTRRVPEASETRAPAVGGQGEFASAIEYAASPEAAARIARDHFAMLRARDAWLTGQGTLTEASVRDVLATCAAIGLHPRECAGSILAGEYPFDVLNDTVRQEANLLLRACELSDSIAECGDEIENFRFIRDLPIGRLNPRPLEMTQNETTTFTAFIERTSIVRVSGEDGFIDPDQNSSTDEGERDPLPNSDNLVEYTRETCFRLTATVSTDFRIEGENPQCLTILRSGPHAFAPKWDVTPLAGEQERELRLTRILKRGGEIVEEVPVRPFPIPITVELEPSFAQKVIAWLTEWTGVAEEARNFVIALEALLLAISGGIIWKWLRRRKQGPGGVQPAPPPSALPPAG